MDSPSEGEDASTNLTGDGDSYILLDTVQLTYTHPGDEVIVPQQVAQLRKEIEAVDLAAGTRKNELERRISELLSISMSGVIDA